MIKGSNIKMHSITYFTILDGDTLSLANALLDIKKKFGDVIDVNLVSQDIMRSFEDMELVRTKSRESKLFILHLHGVGNHHFHTIKIF